MERVRETLRTLRPTSGTLVRIAEITGVGLRDSTDGAVVLSGPDGLPELHGSVLRGVADQRILTESTDPQRRRIDVPISDRDAVRAGIVCGGRATLLLTPVGDLPGEAIRWMTAAEPVVLVSAVDGSGSDLVVSTAGASGRLATGQLTEQATARARQLIRAGASVSHTEEIDGATLLFSAAIPTTRALIVGSGPMAEAFGAQGELMGWRVEVSEDVATALSFCRAANPADALLVLSHDPQVDTPTLAAGLDSAVGYIGAMGSRHTQAQRADRLKALGYEDRSRINGPVGLDLGSRTPQETAVAMAAEFLAVRRGRPAASLSDHEGPIHA